MPSRVTVASLRLDTLPTLAGQPIYFAMRRSFTALGTLKLMIDPGTGVFQNSTAWGMECYHDRSTDCLPAGSQPQTGVWGAARVPRDAGFDRRGVV